MPRKEFIKLMEQNILTLDRMAQRLKLDPAKTSGYPRQQMAALVRLYVGGTARLKDIAGRDFNSVPNLCTTFRKLESEGLVARRVDDTDRRNTFYSITPAGAEIARGAIDVFRDGIGVMFANLTPADEGKMIGALKTINDILNKMEIADV